jgi:hypothetical protein
VGQARLGNRELDEDAVLGERGLHVGGDRDREPAYSGRLARVPAERSVSRSLERAHQAQLRLIP